jgi:molecular chaperone DnaJ
LEKSRPPFSIFDTLDITVYSVLTMAKNYYDILGVEKKATTDDIKKAFRKLAQKHHPDKGGDESVFKEITEAYSVLGDEKKRREYDSYGQTFGGGGAGEQGFDFSQFGGFGGGSQYAEFDLSDLFEGFGDMFGGGRQRVKRGRDISIDVEISFKESVLGVKRSVLIMKVGKCDTCEGSGAKPGTSMDTCKTCNGQGKMHETRNSPLGAFTSVRTCATCEGTGKVPKEKCTKCTGKGVLRKEEEIKLEIPRGIDGGEMIRMPQGGEAIKGGVSGDLYVKVHVKPHPTFKKQGANLIMELPIKLTDALLGTTVSVTTIDDKQLEVKVPPMSTPEETLRLRGKGVSFEGGAGDLLVHVTATLPRKLSGKAKKAIEDLKAEGL